MKYFVIFLLIVIMTLVGAHPSAALTDRQIGKKTLSIYMNSFRQINKMTPSMGVQEWLGDERVCLRSVKNRIRESDIEDKESQLFFIGLLFIDNYLVALTTDKAERLTTIKTSILNKSKRLIRNSTSGQSALIARSLAAQARLILFYRDHPRMDLCGLDSLSEDLFDEVLPEKLALHLKSSRAAYSDQEGDSRLVFRAFSRLLYLGFSLSVLKKYDNTLPWAFLHPHLAGYSRVPEARL